MRWSDRKILGTLALLAAMASGIVACEGSGTTPVVTTEELELGCDNLIDGDMTHNLTSQGVREAFLQAQRACLWENADTILVEGFRLTVYQTGTGVEQAVVTGDRGLLNMTNRRMRANGNAVLVIPAQGRRIESEELFYDPQGNRMYSDSATVMYMDGRVVEGSGFDSDLQFENVLVRQFRTRPGGSP